MRHDHPIKTFHTPGLIPVLIGIMFFFLTMTSPFVPIFAQEKTPAIIDIPTVDEMLERIRFLYQMKQYSQVLTECQKLEQRNPGNKMASYYKSRAEAKLVEMGIKPDQPTPMVSQPGAPPSQGTPLATVSPFPEKTTGTPFPTSPGPMMPTQTPLPKTTSPFMAPQGTPTQTPAQEQTAEIKIPEASPVPGKTYVPAATPAPARTQAPLSKPAPPPPGDNKKSGRIKQLMFYAIIALIAVVVIIVLVLGILLYRKYVMKKQLIRLQKAYEERQASQLQEAMTPAASPELTELEPDEPIFPEAFGQVAGQEEPEPALAPDAPSPEAAPATFATEEPADIPSPSSLGALKTEVMPEGELPDIPSPTEPRIPQEERMAESAEAFSGFPPDLPTLMEAEELSSPPPPPGPEELELPMTIRQEKEKPPVPEPAPFAEQTPEEPFTFDLAKPEQEALPTPTTDAETPPAFEQTVAEMPAPEGEIEVFPAMPISQEEAAGHSPSISIEEALGMDFSLEKTPEVEKTRVIEQSPVVPEKDVNATTMDLNMFLFDSDSEDKAETILDVPGRLERRAAAMTGEPAPDEQEQETPAKSDVFESFLFDESALAETKIKTPETPREKTPVSPPVKSSMSLQEESREPMISTTPRMERLSPFEKQELKDHGIILPSKPPIDKKDDEPEEKDISQLAFEEIIRSEKELKSALDEKTIAEHLMTQPLQIEEGEAVPAVEEESLMVSPDSFQGQDTGFKVKEEQARRKVQDRNEILFNDQFRRGKEAFEKRDWKKAVHYLTVASAVRPDNKELKDMLAIARQEKRKSELNQ